jgi:uncharacterized protein YdhG (YjbR/CyaY superfamily)
MPFTSHDDYFASCAPAARPRLLLIQQEVEQRVAHASRCIGYNMPAFRLQRIFFYFAAFKHHVGVYPPLTDDALLVAETTPFRGPKGNLSFAHRDGLPIDLIGRVAAALALQYDGARHPGIRPPPQAAPGGRRQEP